MTSQPDLFSSQQFVKDAYDDSIRLMKDTLDRSPTICPCCEGAAHIYPRQIYSTMIFDMITYYKTFGLGYGHITTRHGDYMKFRFWGFIEAREDEPVNGSNSSGYWRITGAGERYLLGQIPAIKYKWLFENECFAESGKFRSVHESIKKKFNYYELMGIQGNQDEQ